MRYLRAVMSTVAVMLLVTASMFDCQSQCLDEAEAFIVQCINSGGSPSACTQAGHFVYCQCMKGSCPDEPTPECNHNE